MSNDKAVEELEKLEGDAITTIFQLSTLLLEATQIRVDRQKMINKSVRYKTITVNSEYLFELQAKFGKQLES